jgi:hypothetical protein
MTRGPLSADDIRRLFGELASELDAVGQRAEIFLVGGAAIALCFDGRRATRDLDAIFVPTDSVRRAAATVADREAAQQGTELFSGLADRPVQVVHEVSHKR